MKKLDKKTHIKIIGLILIFIWMVFVFAFSGQGGTESTGTSRKVTEFVVQVISDKSVEENGELIGNLDKIVRKLAHYTIYTIGGMLIYNYANTTEKSKKQKILYSIAFGAGYAMTDELHQFFVPGRSARIFDVGIDTLGVITGVLLYLVMLKIIQNLRSTQVKIKGETKGEY